MVKKKPQYKHLSLEDRVKIRILLAERKSLREIGVLLKRDVSTISREIKRCRKMVRDNEYDPLKANKQARDATINSRSLNSKKNPEILKYVEEKLHLGWSPEQISGRLSIEHPQLHICHETVYRYLYREKRSLIGLLPRKHRKRQTRANRIYNTRKMIPDRISIDLRPQSIEQRNHYGHWESDSMVCGQSVVSINTLVERKSRFTLLKRLENLKPQTTALAVMANMNDIKANGRKTITYDNGIENKDHALVNHRYQMKSYFCNPYHSWEKGTVENTNGLVRRYIPKKTNLALITQNDLNIIQNNLNHRPRKCLKYKTPLEVFNHYLL